MTSSCYQQTMKNRKFRPFRMGHLPADLVLKAEQELGETEQVKAEAIPALRELVEGDKKLKCFTDDEYLLQYLRARKYKIDKAFALLQSFYQVKSFYPQMFLTPNLPLMKRLWKTGTVAWLPYRDEGSCPLLLIQIYRWDADVFTFVEIAQALTVAAVVGIEDPATQVSGIRLLVDVRDGNLKQLRHVTPYIPLLARALRNCMPLRFKGIHFYNESVLFQYFFKILKLFLSDKIKNRVHFHGDSQKDLHKHIPKAILPIEYGGENDIHSSAVWFPKEVERFDDRYIDYFQCGYQS